MNTIPKEEYKDFVEKMEVAVSLIKLLSRSLDDLTYSANRMLDAIDKTRDDRDRADILSRESVFFRR